MNLLCWLLGDAFQMFEAPESNLEVAFRSLEENIVKLKVVDGSLLSSLCVRHLLKSLKATGLSCGLNTGLGIRRSEF